MVNPREIIKSEVNAMTAKEYLQQAHRLDHRIESQIRELEDLKAMAGSVGSPSFEMSYNPNRPTEAPFVKVLEKLWDLEVLVAKEMEQLVELKSQIHHTINALADPDEQLVLRYCYIEDKTWDEISEVMHAGRTTVIRWHNQGLYHIEMPENPIEI